MVSEQQRNASKTWKSKVTELLEYVYIQIVYNLRSLLTLLPSEEFCQVSKYVTDKMNVLDATYSSRDILERFATEVPSEDVSAEIRRMSKLVTIKDFQLDEQDFGNTFPRTKVSHFVMAIPNSTQILNFYYSSQSFDISRGATVEMSVQARGRSDLEGVLWSYSESSQRTLNGPLLSSLRHAFGCHPSFGNKEFVHFLLGVCEAETGGGVSIIQQEMEEMESYELFSDINDSLVSDLDSTHANDSKSNFSLSSPSQEESMDAL
jgi:hypothetical protein